MSGEGLSALAGDAFGRTMLDAGVRVGAGR